MNIIRGSDRTVRIHLKKSSGDPLDLTSCTAVTVSFKDENDAVVTRTLADADVAFANRGGGMIDVTLDKTFTAALKIAERQTFQVELVIDEETRRVYCYEALTVEAAIDDE